MANLTSDRDMEFVDRLHRDALPVAASVKLFNGAAVALAAGFAVHAGAGRNGFRGICDGSVDNSAGGAGDETVKVITPEAAYWDGTFTQADVGKKVYFSDDHTVTATAGKNTYAGRIKAIGSDEVLVDMRGAYAGLLTPSGTSVAPTTAA